MKWSPKNLFTNRLRRSYFILGTFLVNLPVGIFLMYYFGELRFSLYKELWLIVAICLFGMFSLIARRLHDMSKSAGWSILFVLPMINILFLFLLFIYPGTDGKNNYGELKSRGVLKEVLNIN
ncbi:MAG: DUF805 domain-containing protein [Patescibacteria group bacterium]